MKKTLLTVIVTALITIVSMEAILYFFQAPSFTQEELDTAYAEGQQAGYEEGRKAGYNEGYESGKKIGYTEGYNAPRPLALPQNGEILYSSEDWGWNVSQLTINGSSNANSLVSVRDQDGVEVLRFFVRVGQSATLEVPGQWLQVYFASGKQWYGYGKGLMFGEHTTYSKDVEFLDFGKYSYEYTLTPVTGGNFQQTPSDEADFFS